MNGLVTPRDISSIFTFAVGITTTSKLEMMPFMSMEAKGEEVDIYTIYKP